MTNGKNVKIVPNVNEHSNAFSDNDFPITSLGQSIHTGVFGIRISLFGSLQTPLWIMYNILKKNIDQILSINYAMNYGLGDTVSEWPVFKSRIEALAHCESASGYPTSNKI